MLKPSAESEHDSDLKQAFLRHLPERIGAIEQNWNSLIDEGWSQVKLTRLFQRIQDLAGSAGKFGLIQVSESVFSLELRIKQFISSETRPSPEHLSEVSSLIAGLRSAGGGVKSPAEAILRPDSSKLRIYYLHGRDDPAPGLNNALENLGCAVAHFLRVEDLMSSLAREPSAAIVADAQLLPQLEPLTEWLKQQREGGGSPPALTAISATSDLHIRLSFMRAGAAAFFVTPLDIPTVAGRIQQLATPDSGGKYRVMIVDDDPAQAEFAAAILRKADMDTRAITEPLRVLENMDAFRPDLILMDLYMPDADGIELTSIIREQNEFVGIPIVFLSGEQDTDKQLDALSVGGDDFIAKPIRPRHLITTIKNRIQRVRALQGQTTAHTARDPVTGLFNRRHFFERLESALSPQTGQPVSGGVLYAELDGLTEIRKRVGSGQADGILAEIGALIAAVAEPQDITARLDDDSFAITAKRPLDKQLTQLAEALVGAVAQTTAGIADASARPSLSVGLCYFDAAPEDAAGLVSRAAKACAAARSAGGGRVEVYRSPAVESDAIETPNLPELIRSALQENGFQVLFQPFVNLKDTECESYEMMLRLRSGDGDQISAGEFLPTAKLEGLSRDIDRWICRQALDVMVERRQTGNETKLLIAQTADTLVDGSGIDWLRDELRRRQLIGTGLILEFNLVDVANNLKASKALIGQLKEMGIAVCLARFGHNDASYKLLNFLGAGYVKVVEKLLKAETRIIANLVERLHELNTQVIVPRVDDPRLIGQQWLSGADYVQGNAIQRPAESADYDFSERL